MKRKLPTIGFIGTGIIGLPMAFNLIKNNYNIYAYVRNIKNHRNVKKTGCLIINDLTEFYEKIDILILAVSDTKDVEEILVGTNGLIKFSKTPKIVIDMSTICPIETISMSKKLSKFKISLFILIQTF